MQLMMLYLEPGMGDGEWKGYCRADFLDLTNAN